MKAVRQIGDRVSGLVGELGWPTLGSSVELPVYIIHNSIDPEDYFFIFDFEEFVESGRRDWFARPKLRLWAGRSDFKRRAFARQLRESFAREFELARQELAEKAEAPRGWFSGVPKALAGLAAPSLPGAMANIVLLVAVSAGNLVLRQILPSSWTRRKTDQQKLEDGIEETKSKVDAALETIEITLHMELYRHAWHGHPPGRLTGMDYDAWPLPNYVRVHLTDGASGSWW
ncbi:MAG: hypothetical protein AAGF27_07780 [Pseudomonadota bacterium]